MTPYALHSLAAAWSLHAARQHLARRAEQEAAAIAAELLIPADGIRSTVYGTRRSSGGHSDPTTGIVLGVVEPAPRVNRWQQLADRTTSTLAWLATQTGATGDSDPLHRLQAAIPTLQPATAANLHKWLAEADDRIRLALGLDPDRHPIPDNPACPHCDLQMLRLQAAAPDPTHWTVICGNDRCACAGTGCDCGMQAATEGTRHIWPATRWVPAEWMTAASRKIA